MTATARPCRWLSVATLFAAGVVGILGVVSVGISKMPAVVTSASYLSAESDIIDTPGWIRTLYGVQLDDAGEDGRKCAKEDKVLHRASGQCYLLFTRGPCGRYEWLVFDQEKAKSGNLSAVCARRKCAPKWGYDAAAGKCFEQDKCRFPMVFQYTLFGDGVCRCNGTTGRLVSPRSRDNPEACYELYHNTPCPKGQMVAPRYRLIEGLDAVCFRDPCDGYKPPVNGSTPATPATPTAVPTSDVTTSAPALKRGSNEPPPHVHTHAPHDHRDGSGHHHHVGSPHDNLPHTNNGDPPSWDGFSGGGGGINGFLGSQSNPSRHPFPRGEASFDDQPPQSGFDFEVEVMPVPNRPNLGIRTSTRAVVQSNQNNNSPPRNIGFQNHNNGPQRQIEGAHVHHHDSGLRHGSTAAQMQHHGLPGFKITLTPFHMPDVTSLLTSGRKRRGAPRTIFESRSARDARGEASPRVDWEGTRGVLDSRDVISGKVSGGSPQENPDVRGGVTTARSSDRTPAPSSSRSAPGSDNYALQVQYGDGTRSCMSTSQLNAICDFAMVPLFSDFSELKVPICVNALFRFAIGRVGKSEECVEKDDGVCATQVIVKSPDPLDWDLE